MFKKFRSTKPVFITKKFKRKGKWFKKPRKIRKRRFSESDIAFGTMVGRLRR